MLSNSEIGDSSFSVERLRRLLNLDDFSVDEGLLKPNKERFLRALNLEEADRITCVEWNIQPRNVYYFLGVRYNYAALDPVDRIEFLNRTCASDSLIQFAIWIWSGDPIDLLKKSARMMRANEEWDKTHGVHEPKQLATTYEDSSVKSWADLHDLELYRDNFDALVKINIDRVKECMETVRGTNVGVATTSRSVLQNTYQTLGITRFSKMLYTNRDLVEHIMDIYMDYSVKLAEAASELPVDFFVIDDDMGHDGGPFISPKVMEDLWFPRTEMILKPLKRKGIPLVFHTDGRIDKVIPLAIDLGIKGIHPIQPNCNDIYEYKKRWGDKICLIGNIDIAGILAFGTPEEVENDVKEHIDRLADPPGYVVHSSHSITEAIPPENFAAQLRAVLKYGVCR